MTIRTLFRALNVCLLVLTWMTVSHGQASHDSLVVPSWGVPLVFKGDTLLFIQTQLGPFSPQQRVAAIRQQLDEVYNGNLSPDSIRVVEKQGFSDIELGGLIIMAVTDEDAAMQGKDRAVVSHAFAARIQESLKRTKELFSWQHILVGIGMTLLLIATAVFLFWLLRKIFPRAYAWLEQRGSASGWSIRFRSYDIVSARGITSFFLVLLKGIRLAITLTIVYLLITYSLSFFPWTRSWNVKPILIGIFLTILTTTAAIVALNAMHAFFNALTRKISGWKGTLIVPIKLKTVEVLSEERIVDLLEGSFKLLKLLAMIMLGYLYMTLIFSFFEFTQTWAATLIGYIVDPLWNVLLAFVHYLPNLFFILVILYVSRVVIKFVKRIFQEIGKGVMALPGFYQDWAEPTYEIIRFLIIVFTAIVIFPYLPGSSSPVFQGISVFLGILFSLGSTSAISNVVAGVVLTYMRPFTLGDRVKIADTMGDVIEKTLLVTRVRTIKNVDITIPNAMVLGSHIINFSSSAQDRGLILHTSVTIGYDIPWKTVHALLIAAAEKTENILQDPTPFVLQTSLDDFYVNYELNAYTFEPNMMARTYSELHKNIQDSFNEGGVEIMSPHYSGIRDGNMTTIPESYLPASYQAPGFRIVPTQPVPKKPDASST